MKNDKKKFFIISASLLLISILTGFCLISWTGSSVSNLDEFNRWLNKENNGCIINHHIAGIDISVKYQPPLYIVQKDRAKISNVTNRSVISLDSLLSQQRNMLTFLMTIGPDKTLPDKGKSSSIMSQGVNGYNEYVERVMSTNFMMDQHLALFVDGKKFVPALCLLENLYELSEQRSFVVVFVADANRSISSGKEYIFEYDDPYFGAGKLQFQFSSDNLLHANNLKIAK